MDYLGKIEMRTEIFEILAETRIGLIPALQ